MKKDELKEILETRKSESNKSTYGRLLIMGGSLSYPGSILIAASAALRTGVGYVALGVNEETYDVVSCKIPEVIYEIFKTFKDKEKLESILKYDTICFGNGFTDKNSPFALDYLLSNYEGNLVIDATGLDTLKYVGLDKLKTTKAKVILTPHVGEFKRLFDVDIREDFESRKLLVEGLCKDYNCTIDLKDHISVVSNGKDTYVVSNGSSGLAKAGSGDMLCGLVGGFITHIKKDPALVTYFAHSMMNEACNEVSKKMSLHSITASDVISKIGKVLRKYEY